MNGNQLINMGVRVVMRKLIGKGVDAGMNRVSQTRGKGDAPPRAGSSTETNADSTDAWFAEDGLIDAGQNDPGQNDVGQNDAGQQDAGPQMTPQERQQMRQKRQRKRAAKMAAREARRGGQS